MEVLLLYLLLGGVAGVVGGLFGLGGGVVIVPLLILSFTSQGFDPEVLTHMAIGTSLATIVVTSASAAWVHHQRGAVMWPVFAQLAPGIAMGAVAGGFIASGLSGLLLQLIFGVLLVAVAIQAGLGIKPAPHRNLPGKLGNGAIGAVFGSLSALFGIGGGSLTTPYLLWCNVTVHKAIGTSAACGFPIGLFAAVSYIVSGWGVNTPEGSLGYVYLPAFLGISLAATITVRWGAVLAHRLPAQSLKRMFAAVIFLLGVRFIWVNILMFTGTNN